jgi:hypothetical protein
MSAYDLLIDIAADRRRKKSIKLAVRKHLTLDLRKHYCICRRCRKVLL